MQRPGNSIIAIVATMSLLVGCEADRSDVSGDWAIERHVDYQMTIFGDGAEPMPLYFKGVYILRRQEDGSWKIAQYIWNQNIP